MTSPGSGVPDGVLRAVRRAGPHRHAAQVGHVLVAEMVWQRLKVGDPARGPSGARVEHMVGGPRRDQGRLVDHRALVAGRAAPRGPAATRHVPEGSAPTPSPTGRTRTSPSRFRSDPLTRIRNE